MEKRTYVLWKRPGDPDGQFREEILGATAEKLKRLGLGGLSVNLADEASVFARRLRITRMEDPVAATVSVWLDPALSRDPVEQLLTQVAARIAGYSVRESVPIVNTTRVVPPGERNPGITTVAFLEKPDGMTYETWLDRWQGHHTKVAIETQSTYLYIQNVVVRALTEDAPPWTAIVEEGFPAEAATDPMVFFNAGNSREKLEENQRRMMESCRTFIDFSRLESHPMSTYVIIESGDS
jgi:hypothetical protein